MRTSGCRERKDLFKATQGANQWLIQDENSSPCFQSRRALSQILLLLSQPGNPAMLGGGGEDNQGEPEVRTPPSSASHHWEQISRKPSGWPGPSTDCRRWHEGPRLPWRLPESQPLFPLRLWEAETYLGSSCAPAGPLPRGGRRRGGAGNVANPRAIESAPCRRSSPAPGQARETELKCSMMAAAGM